MKILFIGDSITDDGRTYEDFYNLGYGYPRYFKDMVRLNLQADDIEIINKGISGNRVCDLEARWQEDCLDIKPDLLSILIGINDTWRRFDSNDETTTQEFYDCYRRILTSFKEECPNAEILMIEPFVLPYPADRKDWRVDLDPKIQAVRELAAEFADYYIALDGKMAEKAIKLSPEALAGDGVHPTDMGHLFIAQEIMNTLFGI